MNPDTASADALRWVLVFVAEPGEVPAGRRMAQLLRYAKRRQGMKCIEVSERMPEEQLQAARDEVRKLRAGAGERNTTTEGDCMTRKDVPRGIYCPDCRGTRLTVTATRRKPGLTVQYRRCAACDARIVTEVRVRKTDEKEKVPDPSTPPR